MKIDTKHIITKIDGEDSFKTFLLGHSISIGTTFTFSYTSKFSGLVNVVVCDKILSVRKNDFDNIEFKAV